MLDRKFAVAASKVRRKLFSRKGFTGDILINPEMKCCYLAIPKCANSTLKTAFLLSIEDEKLARMSKHVPEHILDYSPVTDKEVRKYLTDENYLIHRNDVLKKVSSFARVAIFRDPLERIHSCWRDKIAKEPINNWRFTEGVHNGFLEFGSIFWSGMSFEDFAYSVSEIPDGDSNPHFRSQVDFVFDRNGDFIPNYVGFVESLSDDFANFPISLNRCFEGIGKKNSVPGSSDVRDVADEALGVLAERYARDIELVRKLRSNAVKGCE